MKRNLVGKQGNLLRDETVSLKAKRSKIERSSLPVLYDVEGLVRCTVHGPVEHALRIAGRDRVSTVGSANHVDDRAWPLAFDVYRVAFARVLGLVAICKLRREERRVS